MDRQFEPIATVSSPYKQKFAIPRQANLVPEAEAEIIFSRQYSDSNTIRGIEHFSHLWILFLFHATADQGWSPTVQPPRLGGRERIGVFATRSPFRPNPIGLSAVRLLGHEVRDGRLVLRVGGPDMLDGTPVLDIKPYLPYADRMDEASAGFAEQAPGEERPIGFSDEAEQQLDALAGRYPQLRQFITSILGQDPRPAWRVKDGDDKRYGMTLYDLNIKWRLERESVNVLSIVAIGDNSPAK